MRVLKTFLKSNGLKDTGTKVGAVPGNIYTPLLIVGCFV